MDEITILIIEDDEDIRESVKILLENCRINTGRRHWVRINIRKKMVFCIINHYRFKRIL